MFIQAEAEIGRWLTIQSEMKEFGVLRQTINRALKAAGISPRGVMSSDFLDSESIDFLDSESS